MAMLAYRSVPMCIIYPACPYVAAKRRVGQTKPNDATLISGIKDVRGRGSNKNQPTI